jgi:hypothetical protein
MQSISIHSPKNKGDEYESLMARIGKKTHVSELPVGCIIQVPRGAQVSTHGASARFARDSEPAYLYAVVDKPLSAFYGLLLLPIPWAKALPDVIGHIEATDEGWGYALLERCRYQWQMSRNYARHVQMLAPSLSEYLGNPCPFEEGSSHAA